MVSLFKFWVKIQIFKLYSKTTFMYHIAYDINVKPMVFDYNILYAVALQYNTCVTIMRNV